MCYWIGNRKVRDQVLRDITENPNDEIARLYYEIYLKPTELSTISSPHEHFVAIGKGKPTISVLCKENGLLAFKNMQWTMQWSYFDKKSNTEKAGRPLINAMSENVFWQHKKLIYTQRCVIPAEGYWEFRHFMGETYPYFIYPSNKKLFYFAGIYKSFVDKSTGEIFDTFTILTTKPNSITEKLHNNPKAPNGPRMLVIMDQNQIHDFLNEKLTQKELQEEFFKPYAVDKMKYHPTIRFLKCENAEYSNSEKVQEPFEYSELVA